MKQHSCSDTSKIKTKECYEHTFDPRQTFGYQLQPIQFDLRRELDQKLPIKILSQKQQVERGAGDKLQQALLRY